MSMKLKPREGVRYFDAPQLDRDLSAREQAEWEAKRTHSRFLAEGPSGRRTTAADLPKVAPIHVPTAEVADISALVLRREADKAGFEIASALKPYGFRVKRGDPTVSMPFSVDGKKVPHLVETEACRIPLTLKDGSPAMMVVRMTNFDQGRAFVTPQGLQYKGVEPKRLTRDERPAFRVVGFRADENGKLLAVEPSLTAEGMAWKAGNVGEIVGQFKAAAVKAAQENKARPIPTPNRFNPADPRQARRQPSASAGMRV